MDGGHVRVIDFDDAGFGWHLYELAIVLYYYQDAPNFELMRRALIAGYRSRTNLVRTDSRLAARLHTDSCARSAWLDQGSSRTRLRGQSTNLGGTYL